MANTAIATAGNVEDDGRSIQKSHTKQDVVHIFQVLEEQWKKVQVHLHH